jgi:hypothetical protein
MKPGVQTDGRTGSGYDHDDRFGSFSSPQDRRIATLRYAAANADRLYKSALAQSEQVAESLAVFGHDQANDTGLGGPRRKRKTLATVDVAAMPDQPAYEDIDLGYDSPYEQSGTWGSHAPSGKLPSQTRFSDGSSGPKIRKYKRPAHLQAELDRFEAAVGAPVLRYSNDQLAALGLTKSTAPFDMEYLF